MKIKSNFLSQIKPVSTAHRTGLKQVFLSEKDTNSNLTQFAYGKLKPGEGCQKHKHPTMLEYFFFIKGKGIYLVGDEKIEVDPELFLGIPADEMHSLRNTGKINLLFVYFGVKTDE